MTWDRMRRLNNRVGLPLFVVGGVGFVLITAPLRWWFVGLAGIAMVINLAAFAVAWGRNSDDAAP